MEDPLFWAKCPIYIGIWWKIESIVDFVLLEMKLCKEAEMQHWLLKCYLHATCFFSIRRHRDSVANAIYVCIMYILYIYMYALSVSIPYSWSMCRNKNHQTFLTRCSIWCEINHNRSSYAIRTRQEEARVSVSSETSHTFGDKKPNFTSLFERCGLLLLLLFISRFQYNKNYLYVSNESLQMRRAVECNVWCWV